MKTIPSSPRTRKPADATRDPKPITIPDRFQLLIDCRDEAEQRKLFEELTARGHVCRVWVM